MKTLKTILKWLSGKKSTIVALIALTVSFCQLKNVIDSDTSVYINTFMLILAYGANYATSKLVYKK